MLETDGESLKAILQWGLGIGGIIAGAIATYIGAMRRRAADPEDDEDRPLTKKDIAKLLDDRTHARPPADRVTKSDLLEAMAKLTQEGSRERGALYSRIEAAQASTKADIQTLDENIREWVRDIDRKFNDHDKRIRENEVALAKRPR